jgi:hypothetical protein
LYPVNLDLHGNEITGTVSTAFGLLTGLGTYLASSCKYSSSLLGAILMVLFLLRFVVDLNLDFNQHSGTIPTEFGLLVALESLKLDNNNLTGTVPSELSLLTMLGEYCLRHKDSKPSGHFCFAHFFVSSQTRAGLLWLHENDFEGPYTCPPSSVIDDCRISCSSYFNAECRTLS